MGVPCRAHVCQEELNADADEAQQEEGGEGSYCRVKNFLIEVNYGDGCDLLDAETVHRFCLSAKLQSKILISVS